MTATTENDPTARAILDATLRVIGERGIKGATTRAIAERAQVNEVTLFRKFGSKTNMIKAAIAERFTTEADATLYTGDIEADLIRLADNYQRALIAYGSFARVLLTELPLHPELVESADRSQRLFVAIATMLRRYQEDGALQDEALETLIPAFLGPIVLPYLTRDPRPGTPAQAPLDTTTHVRRFLHGRIRNH